VKKQKLGTSLIYYNNLAARIIGHSDQ